MMYIIRQRKVLKGEKGCNIFNIKPTPTTPHPPKKYICLQLPNHLY